MKCYVSNDIILIRNCVLFSPSASHRSCSGADSYTEEDVEVARINNPCEAYNTYNSNTANRYVYIYHPFFISNNDRFMISNCVRPAMMEKEGAATTLASLTQWTWTCPTQPRNLRIYPIQQQNTHVTTT